MESTTDLNEAAGKVRSRRVLLAGAVGGLAAWLAAAAQRAMPAEASAGDPVLAGRSNSGGGFSTELRANTTKATLRAVQLGGGAGLRAEATTGRAVMATAGSAGTGVFAYSPDHNAVYATTDSGVGLKVSARSSGTAIEAFGEGFNSTALVCTVSTASGSYAIVAHGKTGFSGNMEVFGSSSVSGNLDVLGRASVGTASVTGAITFSESASPTPSTDRVRLFARDNGVGKTELCVRFGTGDVQVLATEP